MGKNKKQHQILCLEMKQAQILFLKEPKAQMGKNRYEAQMGKQQ